MEIRFADLKDLEAINEIYNYEVLNGVATFDIDERSIEAAKLWFNAHNQSNHPIFVAVNNGEILGFCSLSQFHPRKAYEKTVEISIYISQKHRHEGIGKKLVEHTLNYASTTKLVKNILAVICSSNNSSIKLFQGFDFIKAGDIPCVGEKFSQNLGISYLYKLI